jgi:hypothetical protein
MLRRIAFFLMDPTASRGCERLIQRHGHGALAMARHAVFSAGETGMAGSWTRVLAEVERRSSYRPF